MFLSFETWTVPGLAPPPAEALKLLHRLAADPGIAGIMRKHSWAVGKLSEMPPEGKVRLLLHISYQKLSYCMRCPRSHVANRARSDK